MPANNGDKIILNVRSTANDLLPRDMSYYRYSGSLTTPPCSEGVNWMVLKTPVEVSEAQIKQFNSMMHNNNRPIMPVMGRAITSH